MDKKILVACPTYSGKDYSLDSFLTAFNGLDFPNKSLFMVDNSQDNYKSKLDSKGIDSIHIDLYGDITHIVNESWKYIIEKAINEKFDYVLSNEADNINPPETINVLLEIAEKYKCGVVAHEYPDTESSNPNSKIIALGCTLISIDLLRMVPSDVNFGQGAFPDSSTYYGFEGYIYELSRRNNLPIFQLSGILDTKHLK